MVLAKNPVINTAVWKVYPDAQAVIYDYRFIYKKSDTVLLENPTYLSFSFLEPGTPFDFVRRGGLFGRRLGEVTAGAEASADS